MIQAFNNFYFYLSIFAVVFISGAAIRVKILSMLQPKQPQKEVRKENAYDVIDGTCVLKIDDKNR